MTLHLYYFTPLLRYAFMTLCLYGITAIDFMALQLSSLMTYVIPNYLLNRMVAKLNIANGHMCFFGSIWETNCFILTTL